MCSMFNDITKSEYEMCVPYFVVQHTGNMWWTHVDQNQSSTLLLSFGNRQQMYTIGGVIVVIRRLAVP